AEIVKVWAFELSRRRPGSSSVCDAGSDVWRSVAGMDAVSCDAETNIVVRLAPFQRTTDEPATKFVPFTVNVNAAPPTVADVGLRDQDSGAEGENAEIGRGRRLEAQTPRSDRNTLK